MAAHPYTPHALYSNAPRSDWEGSLELADRATNSADRTRAQSRALSVFPCFKHSKLLAVVVVMP